MTTEPHYPELCVPPDRPSWACYCACPSCLRRDPAGKRSACVCRKCLHYHCRK